MSPQVPQVKEQGHLLPITVTLSFPDRSDHVSDDHGVDYIGHSQTSDRCGDYVCDDLFAALMTDFVTIIVIMAMIMMMTMVINGS